MGGSTVTMLALNYIQKENQVRLSHLLRLPLDSLEKQYSIYAWNTITVGVLRPLGILDAFNNLWSNIAYVILGLAFIILVAIRHCKTNQMKVKYPHLYHVSCAVQPTSEQRMLWDQ
jgi:uncharacterized membrane protein YuzA (DUF378 family)